MSRFQRGGPAFTKPENALKRAEELIAVGQPHAALQALHDVITSKRHRTWQKILETIMFKYVDLCVDLKKGRFAKVCRVSDAADEFASPPPEHRCGASMSVGPRRRAAQQSRIDRMHAAQDGLIHYRNVCQQVNVQSLEEVIKYFLKTATDRAEQATASADVRPHPRLYAPHLPLEARRLGFTLLQYCSHGIEACEARSQGPRVASWLSREMLA